jgi:hypothetical protein
MLISADSEHFRNCHANERACNQTMHLRQRAEVVRSYQRNEPSSDTTMPTRERSIKQGISDNRLRSYARIIVLRVAQRLPYHREHRQHHAVSLRKCLERMLVSADAVYCVSSIASERAEFNMQYLRGQTATLCSYHPLRSTEIVATPARELIQTCTISAARLGR